MLCSNDSALSIVVTGEPAPSDLARQVARFARRLRSLRQEARLQAGGKAMSQRELARLSGLSPTTLGELERGEHEPRLGTMLALRDALGLGSIEELLGPMPSAVMDQSEQELEREEDEG
jgi:transcriptional regulator with XRE-family HTH domain